MTARCAPLPAVGRAAGRLRAAAVACVAIYLGALFLGPPGHHPWRELGLQVLTLGLVAAYVWTTVLRGVRVGEPWRRQWRTGMAGWVTLFAVGNLVANAHTGPVIPDWANVSSMVFYAGCYPCALLGIVLLHRGRWRRWDTGAVLDSMISGSAIAALFTALILPRAVIAAQHGGVPLVVVLAFPVLDLTVLGLTVAAASLGDADLSSDPRTPSGTSGPSGTDGVTGADQRRLPGWLVLGLALFGTADWQFATGAAEGTWRTGTPKDGVWVIGCAVVGLLACRRDDGLGDLRDGLVARVRRVQAWTTTGIAVPLGSSLVAVAMLAVGTRTELPASGVVLAVTAVTTALGRLAVAYAQVQALDETSRMARTDELTGLLNRRALLETLGRIGAGPVRSPYSVLLTDLDGFKEVNDVLGHAAGDELLRQVAARLRAAVPADGVLARLGGDEFAVVLPDASGAGGVASALVDALAVPLVVAGTAVTTAISVGLATDDARSELAPDELLRRADIAMYVAKRGGGGRVHVFGPGDDHAGPARDDEESAHPRPLPRQGRRQGAQQPDGRSGRRSIRPS